MLARGSCSWLAVSAATVAILAVLEIIASHAFVHFALSAAVFIFAALLVFFRDPERIPGQGIVSPADGVIQDVRRVAGPPGGPESKEQTQATPTTEDVGSFLGVGSFLRIQIFMNVHNVHVNRMPLDAKVVHMEHRRGGFKPAFDKDADSNERVVYELETSFGPVYIVQIAGAVARRIVPYISPPVEMRKGERFGLIRLGSRVDVYLPAGKTKVTVKKGMKVRAGSDTIAISAVEEPETSPGRPSDESQEGKK